MASKFSLAAMKRFPEIAPLCIIMGVALTGVTSFTLYSLFYKTDVVLNKSKGNRWETIDVNQPQKLLTFNQPYGEDQKITELKNELAEAYKKK